MVAAWLALIFGVLTVWLFVHNLILGAQLRKARRDLAIPVDEKEVAS